MRCVSWLSVILLALASSAFGQVSASGVTVSGVVVDTSGGVVPGAALELTLAAPRTGGESSPRQTTTDGVGHFQFDHVTAGRYVVRAVLDGFDPASASLAVGTRSPSPLRLVLVVAGV